MIINTGMRTDIPAFFSEWLINRINDGYVLVRNPYNRSQVTKYSLSPEVVDLIAFCTKNPTPMLKYMDMLKPYGQYWFVTITPYGKDIEPKVPDRQEVMESFCKLSEMVGWTVSGGVMIRFWWMQSIPWNGIRKSMNRWRKHLPDIRRPV